MTLIKIVLFVFICKEGFSFKIDSTNPYSGCRVSINKDLGEPQTLLVNPNADEIYLPESPTDELVFQTGQTINLACPGNFVNLGETKLKEAIAKCVSEKTFSVNGTNYKFDKLVCKEYPEHIARRTGSKCFDNSSEVEIGFQIGNQFLRHILLCHDEKTYFTHYTVFNLTSAINGYQKGFPRPYFEEGDFYKGLNPQPTTLYNRNNQITGLARILGSQQLAEKYIHKNDDLFLSRGHLTAKADFVFGSQHRLTFYYVNTAPQWQTFNGGNWNDAEISTRNYAAERGLDLIVYTGTHGVSLLPDVNGKEQEIYLYVDKNNFKAMPVPQLYWKSIYEPKNKLGVVLIGVNNPYRFVPEEDIICTDVCDKISWVSWKPDNVTLGYSYCCEVDDFRKSVKSLPDFEVKGLLV